MRRMFESVVTLAMLMLTACGGDSAAPTTATPTPASTPAPTPTPSPSYENAADFSRDRSFTGFGVVVTDKVVSLVSIDPQSSAIGFDFVAATRRYQLRYRDTMLGVNSEAQPTTATIGFGRDVYSDDKVNFLRSGFANGLLYVGHLFWSAPGTDAVVRQHRLIFGARTVASDLPTSGNVSYQAAIALPNLYNYPDLLERNGGDRYPVTVTINWATKAVNADFSVARQGIGSSGSSFQPGINMALRGTIDSAGWITGTLNAKDETGGLIEGAVFGPRGVEIGILSTSTGIPGAFTGVGTLLGRQ